MTDKVKRIPPTESLSTDGSRRSSGLIAIKKPHYLPGPEKDVTGYREDIEVINSVTGAMNASSRRGSCSREKTRREDNGSVERNQTCVPIETLLNKLA